MTKLIKTIFLSAALAAFMLPATAQNTSDNSSTTGGTPSTGVNPGTVDKATSGTTAPSVPSAKPPVYKRKDRQQNRIAKGVDSGALTPEEASRLEKREAALNKETRRMRAADGGKLTAADKAKLEKQQNQISEAIHRQKTDSQTMPADTNPHTEINQRKDNQQERIAEGLKSGNLTPEEASKLEKQQSNIREETHEMRAANGGKLTDAEKAKIQRQQNRASQNIHRQKHDNQHR
jgi:hypothetical protein